MTAGTLGEGADAVAGAFGPEVLPVAGAARPATPTSSAAEDQSTFLAGLFGRGLLYVVVTSMPLLTATVVSPVLAHLLGPVQFGLFAATISVHQVLMALALVGLDQALILAHAENDSDRVPRMLVTIGALVAVALTVLVAVTVGFWSGPLGFGSTRELALAAAFWTVPSTCAQLGMALLLAQDRFRSFAVVSLLLSVGSQGIGLVVVLLWERTANYYAWAQIGGQGLAMITCIVLVRPRRFSLGDWPIVRKAFALGLPILLGSLSMFVLNSGDRLVIQRLLGAAEAGRYQIAYTIGFEAFTVFALTGTAWAARFAEVRDDARRWYLLGRARDHLYELLAPTIVGVNLAAPVALRIFAPESFRPEGLLIVVFCVSLSGFPVVAVLGSTRALITQHRTGAIALAAGCAAAVNLALNFILVPRIHLSGAAVATAVAFSVQAVIQRMAFRPFRAWPRTSPWLLLVLLAATAAAGAFVFVDQSRCWMLIRALLAVLCGAWLVVVFLRRRAEHRGN